MSTPAPSRTTADEGGEDPIKADVVCQRWRCTQCERIVRSDGQRSVHEELLTAPAASSSRSDHHRFSLSLSLSPLSFFVPSSACLTMTEFLPKKNRPPIEAPIVPSPPQPVVGLGLFCTQNSVQKGKRMIGRAACRGSADENNWPDGWVRLGRLPARNTLNLNSPPPRLYPMGPSAQASAREDRIGTRREERVVWSSTILYDGFTHSGVAEGAYVRSRRAEDFFSLRGRHPVSDLVWRQGQDQTMSRPSLFIDWTPPRPGVPQERSLACRHYAGHQWGCAAVFFPSLSCPIRPYLPGHFVAYRRVVATRIYSIHV